MNIYMVWFKSQWETVFPIQSDVSKLPEDRFILINPTKETHEWECLFVDLHWENMTDKKSNSLIASGGGIPSSL